MSGVDPRVARTESLVLDAVLDELADRGYGALSVEGVARRAGVGKATIYRHWAGKPELVAAAIGQLKSVVLEDDEQSPLYQRIVQRLTAIASHLQSSRLSACLPALIDAAERDDAVRHFFHTSNQARRDRLTELLGEAKDTGRLAPDVDVELLADSLFGPILVRRLMRPVPFEAGDVEGLVGQVLGPHWIEAEVVDPSMSTLTE